MKMYSCSTLRNERNNSSKSYLKKAETEKLDIYCFSARNIHHKRVLVTSNYENIL